MGLDNFWCKSGNPDKNPWTQEPRDFYDRRDYFHFRTHHATIHTIRGVQLYTITFFLRIILYFLNPTDETRIRIMTYGSLILISWIGIFLQLRFKQLIFYGAPVLLATMLFSNNLYLYLI